MARPRTSRGYIISDIAKGNWEDPVNFGQSATGSHGIQKTGLAGKELDLKSAIHEDGDLVAGGSALQSTISQRYMQVASRTVESGSSFRGRMLTAEATIISTHEDSNRWQDVQTTAGQLAADAS